MYSHGSHYQIIRIASIITTVQHKLHPPLRLTHSHHQIPLRNYALLYLFANIMHTVDVINYGKD